MYAILFGVGLLVGLALFYVYSKLQESRKSDEAKDIIANAQREAERIIKDAEITAKDEVLRRREALEKEIQAARQELRQDEKHLSRREDALERKAEILNKKERQLESFEASLHERKEELNKRQARLDELIEQEKTLLYRVAELTRDEAKEMLLQRLDKELTQECAELINRRIERAKEEAEREAKKILSLAIQRCAAEHTAESTVASIELPDDQMKGRIIGREGRNIRAFEKASGTDVIVDDTPGVVVVSGYDSVRREVARRSMEKLIADGRIHPARIEEVIEATTKEVDEAIQQAGKEACFEMGVHNLNAKLVTLLGRLQFRTSYGQNQLAHALEVASLCGIMAGELGLDVQLAKRCGLLHDIGKAADQEFEGGHPAIGAELAKRYEEAPEVINAIASHHGDVPAESIYAVLVAAADAVSASRPGARRETLEKYIKRLERLEEIANSVDGVESAYAIQAGREVRVIVNSQRVDDKTASKIARDIAKQIEKELSYPGEILVTVIRESRFVEKAH